jgi:hypothetical protein
MPMLGVAQVLFLPSIFTFMQEDIDICVFLSILFIIFFD